MSKLKKYILLTLSLLIVALLTAVIVWYFLVLAPIQDAQNRLDSAYQKTQDTGSDFLNETKETLDKNGANVETMKEGSTSVGEYIQEIAPIIIKKSSLPEAQQSILTTFGFGENITITAEMKVCAETKLGAARLDEIITGSAPSFTEASSLVGCLKN